MSESIKPNKMTRVFISYSHRSADEVGLAQRLHGELTARGHETFIDVGMTAGTDWSQEIRIQIERCDFFLLLLSATSAQSEMVQAEARLAHQARRPDGSPRIIPIRVRFDGRLDYELDAYVGRLQYLSWNGLADDAAISNAVTRAIEGELRVDKPDPLPAAGHPGIDLSRPSPSVDKRLFRTPGVPYV